MGLFTKRKGNGTGSLAETEFVDLRDHEAPLGSGGELRVRVAEMHRVEDIKSFAGLVYEGDMLLIDFSPLAGDEVALKRVTTEFKKIARDVDGDVAGLGATTLIVAPAGVKVDRRKVRVQK